MENSQERKNTLKKVGEVKVGRGLIVIKQELINLSTSEK